MKNIPCYANVPGLCLYSLWGSARPLFPSLFEIVQPTQRGILSDTDEHWCTLTAKAADICASTELAQTLSLLHTHQPPLREDITLLPLVKGVLCDVKWARCAAEYRRAELRWAACVCLPLTSVGLYLHAHSCLQRSAPPFTIASITHSASAENREAGLLCMLFHCEIWSHLVNEIFILCSRA